MGEFDKDLNTPYLEYSVLETEEKEKSIEEILKLIVNDYINTYHIPNSQVTFYSNPTRIRFDFLTEQSFWDLCDIDFRIYSYVYDKIILHNINFTKERIEFIRLPNFCQDNSKPEKNYLVLKITTNFIEPLRRNFRLVYKINEILGCQVYNEEVADGFVRLFKKKEDFEGILLPINDLKSWEDWFILLKLDIQSDLIQNFLKYLNEII